MQYDLIAISAQSLFTFGFCYFMAVTRNAIPGLAGNSINC